MEYYKGFDMEGNEIRLVPSPFNFTSNFFGGSYEWYVQNKDIFGNSFFRYTHRVEFVPEEFIKIKE